MLQVSGLICIPSSPEMTIKDLDNKSGSFFNLNVVSEDSKGIIHVYRASLFVTKVDKDKWEKDLTPGASFLVEGGEWSMYPRKEEGKFPIPGLRLNHFKLRRLAQPMWFNQPNKEK